jgi:signal transduction histidine kinase
MLQVFTNLISNAMAYTLPGYSVHVSNRAAEWEMQAEVRLSLQNTHINIPPADLLNLFDRLYRGHTGLESDQAGTGQGLSICKVIVEVHAGRI